MRRNVNGLPYRLRDLLIAGSGLVIVLPAFVLVALAVPLDSPGPIFFRQERVGKDGRLFHIHKFRTMRVDGDGLQISTSTDDRITRVGRFLRASKIDELPQLLDVIKGDMSLVGPRPEVPKYVALWPSKLRPEILSIRPGITDPASILLRHEAEVLAEALDPESVYVTELLPLKATMYVNYIRNRTFFGDMQIIIDTARAVLSRATPVNKLSRKFPHPEAP